MTATHGEGAYGDTVGVTSPTEHKMAQVGDYVKTATTGVIRAGVLYGGNASLITGKANMSYDVAAFSIVTQRSATSGVMKWANDGTVNVATTAAPGSNSRIDIIYAWHREYALDGTNSDPVIGVVQGTAAAVPTAPSLAAFPGAVELGRATVAAGITATTSATITQTAPFTANAGGVVEVRSTTERDAGSWVRGQLIHLLDVDRYQPYNGTGWRYLDASGLTPVIPTSATGLTATPSAATVTIGTDGKVTSSVAASVSVQYATSDYDNYLIVARSTATATGIPQLRLRDAGGTDSSTNVYDTTAGSGVSIWSLAGTGVVTSLAFELFSPNLAVPTGLAVRGSAYNAGTGAINAPTTAGGHRSSTAYSGFTYFPAGGSLNAAVEIQIYGYSKN